MLRAFIVFYLVEFSLAKWCDDIINFSNSSGDLSSPKPENTLLYPDNTLCKWRITISDINQHIILSFKTFDLEDCNKCTCDFVEIFDVVGPKQISLGRFCGSSLPGPFYSSKQSLLVVFQSDDGNGLAGFTASYSTVLPGAVCRNATRLISSVGNIHSPEFPSHYPNEVDCIWQITIPYINTRMRFNIVYMSIQSCGESGTPDFCSCDYLEIRDGSSSSDRLLATFCGTKKNLPEPIYSSGRHLWVRFKSDGEVVSSGFVASFSSGTIEKGHSCPAVWKYPFKCPQEINTNKTSACCYDNGPSCCEPGGRRCSDDGSSQRDYCPRPTDNKKLKYCCMKQGQPSCCASSGVCTKARFILLFGVIAHVSCVFYKWYHGMSII